MYTFSYTLFVCLGFHRKFINHNIPSALISLPGPQHSILSCPFDLVFIPTVVSKYLAHFTEIAAVGRSIFRPVWPLQWPQSVWAYHDAASHAFLAHPLPAVSTGPCSTTLGAPVFPKHPPLEGRGRSDIPKHLCVWVM